MKYLATIKLAYDTSSQTFDTQKEAEQWLDSQNNNNQHTAIVTIYDNSEGWIMKDWYVYNQGEERP